MGNLLPTSLVTSGDYFPLAFGGKVPNYLQAQQIGFALKE
jgi:hypothetical protein